MIELVADMLMRPTLCQEEFEKERDRSSGPDPGREGLGPVAPDACVR